eukprot:6577700-Pyramimonas_sp.AAC.1
MPVLLPAGRTKKGRSDRGWRKLAGAGTSPRQLERGRQGWKSWKETGRGWEEWKSGRAGPSLSSQLPCSASAHVAGFSGASWRRRQPGWRGRRPAAQGPKPA